MKKAATVLIADDHKLFVAGIRKILEPEFDVVGSAGDGHDVGTGTDAQLDRGAAHPAGRTLDQLATDLHPDADPAAAVKRVRTDITSARRVLRTATGHEERAPGAAVLDERLRHETRVRDTTPRAAVPATDGKEIREIEGDS